MFSLTGLRFKQVNQGDVHATKIAEISQHICPCPAHELTDDIVALIGYYRHEDRREGITLTRDGRPLCNAQQP